MIGLVEDWRKAVAGKEKVHLLAMDTSKAFDTLHHSLTLARLQAYGFSDSSLDLTPENSKKYRNGPSGLCITHIQSPSVQNRRLQDLATLTYKDKYGLVPNKIIDTFYC